MQENDCSIYFDNAAHGEDAYVSRIISPSSSLDIVLDGASCVGGSKASKLAHKVLSEREITNKQELIEAITDINKELFTKEEKKRSVTTLTACLKDGDTLYSLNLGDSPAWIYKGNELEELTTLDSHDFMPNVITNAIGHHKELVYHEKFLRIKHGDTLIIMSDGISDNLPEEDLLKIIQKSKSPEMALSNLKSILEKRKKTHTGDVYDFFKDDDMTAIIRYF